MKTKHAKKTTLIFRWLLWHWKPMCLSETEWILGLTSLLCVLYVYRETSPHAFQLELFFNNVTKPNSPSFNRLGRLEWLWFSSLFCFVCLSIWTSRSSLYPGQISKVLEIQMSVLPVEPVTVASKLHSQQPEGCVCACLTTFIHDSLFLSWLTGLSRNSTLSTQ